MGGAILVAYLTAHIAFLTAAHNGLLWPTALYFAAVPALGSLILGRRAGLVVAVAVIAALVTLAPPTLPKWVCFTLAILIIGLTLAINIFEREMERTTARLTEMRKKAEEATRAKSAFLATMSHEIRTPLNGVIGTLQLLREEEPTVEQRNLLRTGLASARIMLTLLNDVLDYSKFKANGVTLEEISFPRDQIVNNVVTALAQTATSKGVSVDVDIDKTIPEFLLGDPARLQQVVANFLSNAIKFTDKGAITIKMVPAETESAVKISVTDTGIGMTPEQKTRIFEKFTQAETSIAREFGGTGLGLAIAKEIAALIGGEIGAESEYGKGSTFWFTFPMREGKILADPSRQPEERDAAHLAGKKVLVAEDNPTNRMIVERFLQKINIEPDMAYDGGQAVRAASEKHYDLILMDVQMPELDGIEATKLVRRTANPNRETPVIAFTANTAPNEIEACLNAGMSGHLAKPLLLNQLIAMLCEQLPSDASEAARGAA